MRLRPEQLSAQLQKQLLPVYLVFGDEPLQHNEACDSIRQQAREQGFSTREVLEVGSGFDWSELAAEADAFSLFAEKKIIDLRIPSGKPGREGGKALSDYCARPPEDTILLIGMPKIDKQSQSSKWFKNVSDAGASIQVWPIDAKQLPRWISQRLAQAGLQADRDAVQLLADRVEGNLLAAHQEIQKLLLSHEGGQLNAEQMLKAVADSARYDVFELSNTALRGDSARTLRILEGLRGEGVAMPVILWALHRDISILANLSVDTAKGLGMEQALGRHRLWGDHKTLLKNALPRKKTPQWLQLLSDCQQADAAIKGADPNNPWQLLESISIKLCA